MGEVVSLYYPEFHSGVLSISVEDAMRRKDKDGDKKLTNIEFWESQEDGEGEDELSDEEKDEFKTLDQDHDGLLDTDELAEWESGLFHIKVAVETIFALAD